MLGLSNISHILMLRQEEFVQQPIHLKQTLAIEPKRVAVDFHKAPIAQPLNWLGEPLGQLNSKFSPEVIAADMAQFELQNELANQSLVFGGRQRAPDWQLAGGYSGNVRLEVGMILVMC